MAEVVNLLEDLSKKFDLLRSDVDSLKERAGKRKKRKGKHSRRHHTRSRSRSSRQSIPITRGRKSRRDSPSCSRSLPLSPRRGTRGHPEDRRSPPSGVATSSRSGDIRSNATPRDSERNSGPSRAWDEIPVEETPDYNELFAWGIQTMRNALFPPIWLQCLSRLNHWSRKRAQRGFQIVHAC